MDAGLTQYRLQHAEKELLEKTLLKTVSMLTVLLSMLNPRAYGKTLRLRQYVSHICRELKPEGAWQYEMAASVSQLGWIIFPPEMLERLSNGCQLSPADRMMFSKHPFVTKKLLNRIPRLELVARVVERQESPREFLNLEKANGNDYVVDFGSHILRVCLDYDALIEHNHNHQQAIEEMITHKEKYMPDVLSALSSQHQLKLEIPDFAPEEIKVEALETNMVLVDGISDSCGRLLVEGGTWVTRPLMVKLITMQAQTPGVVIEPIRVKRL